MRRSFLTNRHIGFYANGVVFHSPGVAAVRGAPWDMDRREIQTPTGFYSPKKSQKVPGTVSFFAMCFQRICR
jgi:hypothetical protein